MRRRAKRALDVTVASVVLVVASPLMCGIATAIRRTMGSPVLFRQARPGLDGELFEIVKFRTMLHPTDPDGREIPLEDRITRLGAFLRRTSLDELPELWNVLRGDMSLVGPRPLLAEYLPRYTPEQARRHSVPPGITGWAQVAGRHDVKWEQRFALDTWYVDHWSLKLDLQILLKTLTVVTRGQDQLDPSMPDFWFMGEQVAEQPAIEEGSRTA